MNNSANHVCAARFRMPVSASVPDQQPDDMAAELAQRCQRAERVTLAALAITVWCLLGSSGMWHERAVDHGVLLLDTATTVVGEDYGWPM